MKLNQEQIKKIFLSLLMLVALLYCYFTFLLGPVQKSGKDAAGNITNTIPQINDAKKQINKTSQLETQAPTAIASLKNLTSTIPDGEPIAWFPPKMSDFFKSHGIDKCTAHIVSEAPDALPGFKRMTWSIDLPRVEFVPLGQAISGLENDEPLLNIDNVTIDANREDAQFQHAVLTVTTLVKS